jgi:hypothetical protein
MALLDLYLIGHRPQGHDVVRPARPRKVSDLPISFTEELARFMFDFAEQYIHCDEGDEILLMRGQLDCHDIISHPNFVDHFRDRVQNGQHFNFLDMLLRREAVDLHSDTFKQRRRFDLLQQPLVVPPPGQPQFNYAR